MSEQKLLNSKQFAELCDVVPTTVRNWVLNGVIKPAQSVNGKFYFAPEQSVDAYLQTVRTSVNPSFLGLIVENTEEASAEREKLFVESIVKNNPNARAISSLKESLKAMLSQEETPLTEDQKNVLDAKIVSSYINAAKSAISDIIASVYLEDVRTWTYSFDFFIRVISYDKSLDASLVADYKSNKFTSKITTIDGMRSEYKKRMNAVTIRHGLQNCLDNVGFNVEESDGSSSYCMFPRAVRFFDEDDSLMRDILCLYPDDVIEKRSLVKGEILFNDTSSVAKLVKRAVVKEKNNNLSKNGIRTIYRDGYYTVMNASGVMKNLYEAECMRKLCSGDYRFVCVSNMDNLPDSVRVMVETLADQNKVELIEFPSVG